MRVRVGVAVHVAQLDEAAEALGPPMRTTLPSWTATTGEPALAKMPDALAPARPATGTAALSPRAIARCAPGGREAVGVARLGVDGEVALGEAGQRADEVGGQAADQPRAHEDAVDVPVGVVVGEDRVAQVVARRRRP